MLPGQETTRHISVRVFFFTVFLFVAVTNINQFANKTNVCVNIKNIKNICLYISI